MGKLVELPLSPPTCTPNCFLLGFCKFILRVAQNPILSQISPNICEGILHLSNFFSELPFMMKMIIRGSVAVVRDRSIKSQSGAPPALIVFLFLKYYAAMMILTKWRWWYCVPHSPYLLILPHHHTPTTSTSREHCECR